MCVYILQARIYIAIWYATTPGNKTQAPQLITAYYTPNDGLTANDASFYKNKVVSLHYVYGIIKITTRGTTVPLYKLAAEQPKKEPKQGVKNFL